MKIFHVPYEKFSSDSLKNFHDPHDNLVFHPRHFVLTNIDLYILIYNNQKEIYNGFFFKKNNV